MKFDYISIPSWAYPTTPSISEFFTTMALLGLENKRIRISADDQRKILGHNVFGKQSLTINKEHTVRVVRVIAFGLDYESITYDKSIIEKAICLGKSLSPQMTGGKYL